MRPRNRLVEATIESHDMIDHTMKIRVVHLIRTLDFGGLEMVVLDLVRHCDRDAIDPIVVCLGGPGELAPRFEAEGVEVIALHVEKKRLPARVAVLASLLRRLRPAVLHTHNPTPHINGVLAARLCSVPVIVHTKHGRNYPTRKWPVLKNRFASLLSNRVVSVSRDAVDVAVQIEKVPPSKVQVIYNGIDVDRFKPRSEGKPFAMRAIHVARLNPVKDQATLLRAVRLVVDQLPEFQLDIVGDGPAAAMLHSLREELALDANVHFHGMQDDIPQRLQQADMFLLSSISEGVSLTLLEAMACGLPIVATNVGGNPEVVDHGQTGLLIGPRDPQALAKAVNWLCQNADEAQRMGHAGRKRVEQTFSLRAMVSNYENLYRELLCERGHVVPDVAVGAEPVCLLTKSGR